MHRRRLIYEGYRYPIFGLGVQYDHFKDTGEEFAVIRGDLRRLNYTKTVLGPDQGARVLSRCPRAPRFLFLNWYLTF